VRSASAFVPYSAKAILKMASASSWGGFDSSAIQADRARRPAGVIE
jgi:hypothetical protein